MILKSIIDLCYNKKENSNINSVVLFGSRAKKNNNYNSDIDLRNQCPENLRETIQYDIDDIIGIYSCDIVFLRIDK